MVMSVNEKMTTIANAIREKTGETKALNLDDIANGINNVYEIGKSEGASETVAYEEGG